MGTMRQLYRRDLQPGLLRVILTGLLVLAVGCGNAKEPTDAGDSTTAVAPSQSPSGKSTPIASTHASALGWLPPESDMIVHAHVADMATSAVGKALLEASQEGNPVPVSLFGLKPEDVETITLATTAASEVRPDAVTAGPAGLGDVAENGIMVIVTKNPVSVTDVVLDGEYEHRDYNGTMLHVLVDEGNLRTTFAFVNETQILTGPEPGVKAALDRGATSTFPKFAFLNMDQHLAIGVVPRDLSEYRENELPNDLPPAIKAAATTMQQHADRFGLELHLGDDVTLATAIHCDDAKQAEKLEAEFKELITFVQNTLENESAQLGLLANVLKVLSSNLNTSRSSDVARLKTSLNSETVIVQGRMAVAMLPFMMASAFDGGGDFQPSGFGPSHAEVLDSAVPAASYQGGAKQTELTAAAAWDDTQVFDQNGAVESLSDLKVYLFITGSGAKKVIAKDQCFLDEAASNNGRLKYKVGFMDDHSLKMIAGEHQWGPSPEDGVSIPIHFEHPAKDATQIESLQGEFGILVAGSSVEKTVANVKEAIGKPVDDAELKKAGMNFELKKPAFEGDAPSVQINIERGAISHVKFFRKDGSEADNLYYSSTVSKRGSMKLIVNADDAKALDDLKMTFQLHSDLKYLTPTFSVANIAIPTEEEPPTAEQLSAMAWTPSTAQMPADVFVEGRVLWGPTETDFDTNKPLPRKLQIDIDCSGKPVRGTIALGVVKIDSSGQLKPIELDEYEDDPAKELILYRQNDFFDSPVAPGVARMRAAFKHPAEPLTSVKKVTGEFTIVVSNGTEEIVIDNISQFAGKELVHPGLEQAKIKLSAKQDGKNFTIKVDESPAFGIAEMKAIDASGEVRDDVYVSRNEYKNHITHSLFADENAKPYSRIRIRLNKGTSEIKVPFAFENMPVPPIPTEDDF